MLALCHWKYQTLCITPITVYSYWRIPWQMDLWAHASTSQHWRKPVRLQWSPLHLKMAEKIVRYICERVVWDLWINILSHSREVWSFFSVSDRLLIRARIQTRATTTSRHYMIFCTATSEIQAPIPTWRRAFLINFFQQRNKSYMLIKTDD